MPLNTDKIDDTALALLYLSLHDECRAWKGFDWGVLGRLHDKGMIYDPAGRVKSVVFTQEGLERAKDKRGWNVRRNCSRRCSRSEACSVDS